MRAARVVRPCLTVLILLGSVATLAACSAEKRPPSTAAVATAASASAATDASALQGSAPTFVKVPPEENPALLQPAADEAPVAVEPYRLAIEDVLEISIYGETDLQHVEVPVRPDGMISFTFIGDIGAAGRTVEEIRAEMTTRLAKYLRSPQVTIIAKKFAEKRVFVGGEVKSPGVIMLGGRSSTLLDALYKVGLVTEKADLDGAYLIRANKVVAADFKQLVRGDVAQNVQLMDEDIVYVPESSRRYVYVIGEVEREDALAVTQPVPIIEVIAKAGGLKNVAKRREIAIIRGGLKTPEIAVVNIKRLIDGDFSQNIMVQPGDIVYVPTSALGKYYNFIDGVLRSISPLIQGTIISRTVNP